MRSSSEFDARGIARPATPLDPVSEVDPPIAKARTGFARLCAGASTRHILRAIGLAIALLLASAPLDQAAIIRIPQAMAQAEATIRVRVEEVTMLAGTEPPGGGDPDYYAVATILDQAVRSPSVDNEQRIRPNWELAHRAVLENGPRVPVKLQLFDSDSWWESASSADDDVDICGEGCHDVDLIVDVETCQITFGTRTLACGDTISSSGNASDDRARVRLSVTVDPHFESGAFGGPARLRVHCMHDPIWPDDGTSVRISAEALDPTGSAVTADAIEIWEGDGDAPAATCSTSSTCDHRVTTTSGAELSYLCLARQGDREATTGWRTVTVGDDAEKIKGLVTGDRDDRIDIVFHRNTFNFDGRWNATFLAAVHDFIDTYLRRDFILQNQDRFNFWIGKDAASITSSCGFWFPPERHFDYIFVEGAAVVHDDANLRDCAMTHGFSAEAGNDNVFAHESGHMVIGLSDQYCCDSFYWQPDPYPNLYTSFYGFFGAVTCEEDIGNLLAWDYRLGDLQVPGRVCWKFTAYSTDKWQADPWDIAGGVARSLMGDNSVIRAPAARRMEWVLNQEAPDPSPESAMTALATSNTGPRTQAATSGEPRLLISPSSGMPGDLVELIGTGFTPDESDPAGCVGEILWDAFPWDTVEVAADGTFDKRFRIPPGSVIGDRTVHVQTAPPCGGAEFGYGASATLRVQSVDPSRLDKPGDDSADETKLVLAELTFGGADGSEVRLASTQVVTSVPPSDLAKPPLHRVEILDRNGEIIDAHNEWDPLLVRQWNEEGRDPHVRRTTATGYYVLPFTTTLHSMRLIDIEAGPDKPRQLALIDLSTAVDDYCANHSGDPDCVPVEPLVLFQPQSSTVARTEVMTVEVRLHNVKGLYGAQVEASFDPTRVQVVDADPATPGVQVLDGDVFHESLVAGQATVFRNSASNDQGTIQYTISLQGARPGLDAGGALFAVGLRGAAVGDSPLRFTRVRLSDAMSQPIAAGSEDGSITVREIRVDEQKATVSGSLHLERRGSPVAPANSGARVCLGGTCVTTGSDGQFRLVGVRPGTIVATHPSYLRTESAVTPTGDPEIALPPVTLLGGDLDQDALIYYQDGFRINQCWNQQPGGPRWLEQYDVTADGAIDVFDMVAVQYNYNAAAPTAWADSAAGAMIDGRGAGSRVGGGARTAVTAAVGPLTRSGAVSDLERFSTPLRLGQELPASVRLRPADSMSPGLGLVVPVEVVIADAADVFGYALHLEFDPAMLQIADADPRPPAAGVQVRVGDFLDPTSMSIVRNRVDNERGVLELAVSETHPATGSSGEGLLASVDFRTLAVGTSRLHIEVVELYKDAFPDLQPIPVTWSGGSITVAGDRYLIYAPITKARQ